MCCQSFIEGITFDHFPSRNNTHGFMKKSKRNNLRRISGGALYKGIITSTLDRQIVGTTPSKLAFTDDVDLLGA